MKKDLDIILDNRTLPNRWPIADDLWEWLVKSTQENAEPTQDECTECGEILYSKDEKKIEMCGSCIWLLDK